jgi:hypothetical protein
VTGHLLFDGSLAGARFVIQCRVQRIERKEIVMAGALWRTGSPMLEPAPVIAALHADVRHDVPAGNTLWQQSPLLGYSE